MSMLSELRDAAEKTAKTNVEVYSELNRQGAKNSQRTMVAGAGLGLAGITGMMMSTLGVQAATLGTGPQWLMDMGQNVMAAGATPGGIYVAPLVALGAAAVGAVGVLASRIIEKREYRALDRASDAADANPLEKSPSALDWARGLKDVVFDRISNAFGAQGGRDVAFDASDYSDDMSVSRSYRARPGG